MNPWSVCEKCDGEGKIEKWEDRYQFGFGHYTREWTEECPVCEGEGTVEHDWNDCDCKECVAIWTQHNPGVSP